MSQIQPYIHEKAKTFEVETQFRLYRNTHGLTHPHHKWHKADSLYI